MLTSVFLSNFKSFNGSTIHTATLAPLTLIYGPNTAGKSALLQTILFLKDNSSHPLDFLGTANLGSYENVVHKHNRKAPILLGFGWDDVTFDGWARWSGVESGSPSLYHDRGLLLEIGPPNPESPRKGDPCLMSARYILNKKDEYGLFHLERDPDASYSNRLKLPANEYQTFLELSKELYLAQLPKRTRPLFRTKQIRAALSDIQWLPRGDEILPSYLTFFPAEKDTEIALQKKYPELEPFVSELRHHAQRLKQISKSIRYIGPMRPLQDRTNLADYAEKLLGAPHAELVKHSTAFEQEYNDVLSRLQIPYRLKLTEKFHRATGRTLDLALVDQRTKTKIQLVDTGTGLSQILPIVTSIIGEIGMVNLIEQPELHLHPRLQASLAEEIATNNILIPFDEYEEALGSLWETQWIIETHSELFILRIQKLIREGRISPHDVSVLYVDQGEKTGSSIQQLGLDENGEFIDEWPNGFFEESYREIFGADS